MISNSSGEQRDLHEIEKFNSNLNFIRNTYHFLTVAICWSHPTQWPMQRCDFKVY